MSTVPFVREQRAWAPVWIVFWRILESLCPLYGSFLLLIQLWSTALWDLTAKYFSLKRGRMEYSVRKKNIPQVSISQITRQTWNRVAEDVITHQSTRRKTLRTKFPITSTAQLLSVSKDITINLAMRNHTYLYKVRSRGSVCCYNRKRRKTRIPSQRTSSEFTWFFTQRRFKFL